MSDALETRAARMRELLASEPGDEVTWFGLGQTLLALARPGEAAAALAEAVRLRPDYTAAHRDLGRALLAAGRREEAARVLERALAVAEETRDLQTGREIAVLLRRAGPAGDGGEGDAPAGERAPEASRGPRPGSLVARQLVREALRQLASDRFARAIELYQRALEADPELPLAWNGLSVAWRLSGDLDRAIEAARRLAELEPDDPLSHTNLSILYQSRGMIREAEDEKALAMRLQLRSRP